MKAIHFLTLSLTLVPPLTAGEKLSQAREEVRGERDPCDEEEDDGGWAISLFWRDGDPAPEPTSVFTGSLRLMIDGGWYEDIGRVGGIAQLDSPVDVGARATGHVYFETDLTPDALAIGELLLTYRLIDAPYMNFRVGLGANYLFDEFGEDWGVAGHLSADLRPIGPLRFAGSLDGGTLGRTGTLHLRGTAGLGWGGTELFAGWDYRLIGSVELHGPTFGLRAVW